MGKPAQWGNVNHPDRSTPIRPAGQHRPNRTADARDLLGDLVYLRKGHGFTPSRVGQAGTLLLVLGGDHEPFATIRQRFTSAIDSLHDRDVLRAAFGLTPETARLATLNQRRTYYGQTIGRKADTVADREETALVNLRNQLLTGWYPASPLGPRPPELHGGIVQESVHVLTVVNDQRWQETREHYRFLAAFDQADYLTIASDFAPIAVPWPEGNSPFTVRTKTIPGGYRHDFIHHPPMERGQVYDLAFKLLPDPAADDPGHVTEASHAFHERTLSATFEVVFIGVKPQFAWWFKGLSMLERPGRPTEANRLDLGEGSSVKVGFRDLYGGLFAGVGWGW
ncbi:MAG: hypothetical protein LBK28_09350 [Propionibacteriaceae bacterium]|jgi:hypothetical protein|nr:hypothetical protein [Propionibacteriaceae bacterium]